MSDYDEQADDEDVERDDDLLASQEGKGYGDDEGEREDALEDE